MVQILAYVIIGKKKEPGNFDYFFTGSVKAILFPVILIYTIVIAFVYRKKMRWLSKYWLIIAFNRAFDFSYSQKYY